jgi:hypothetical protein
MFVANWGGTKWSYNVETPHGEGPERRDCAQDLGWQVLPFGKELASIAPLDKVFGISDDCWLVNPRSVHLTDQVGGCRMIATLAAVDFS